MEEVTTDKSCDKKEKTLQESCQPRCEAFSSPLTGIISRTFSDLLLVVGSTALPLNQGSHTISISSSGPRFSQHPLSDSRRHSTMGSTISHRHRHHFGFGRECMRRLGWVEEYHTNDRSGITLSPNRCILYRSSLLMRYQDSFLPVSFRRPIRIIFRP